MRYVTTAGLLLLICFLYLTSAQVILLLRVIPDRWLPLPEATK